MSLATRSALPIACLAALLSGALCLVPGPASAEHASGLYRGAGGPFVGGAWRALDGVATGQLFIGGAGYVYLADGRLRLGGGGQASLLSSARQGREGSLRWGGVDLGYDFLGRGRVELPVTLSIGGGSYALESSAPLSGSDDLSLVMRQSAGLGILRLGAGVEFRVARTFKLAFSLGYQLGFAERVLLHGVDLSLQTTFLIPR